MAHSTVLSTVAADDVFMRDSKVERLLLTPAEAAAVLSVSRTTVYELLNRGVLRSIKLGACRRIPVEALGELIDGVGQGGRSA